MSVIITKSKDLHPQCNFCGTREDIYEVKGRYMFILSICGTCVDKIQSDKSKL